MYHYHHKSISNAEKKKKKNPAENMHVHSEGVGELLDWGRKLERRWDVIWQKRKTMTE